MTDPFEWDAARYDALPLPHLAWGRGVLDRLEPATNARVLELGCGTGRDAARLLTERDDVTLLAVDGSQQMLAQAGQALADFPGRHSFRQVDLREAQDFGPLEAAYSVATLHWIPDHRPVFASAAKALTAGGRFVADAGGQGNLANLSTAIDSVFGRGDAWNFASDEDTANLLSDVGLTVLDARLRPDPLVLTGETFRPYLATVVLGSYLQDLNDQDRIEAVDAVARAAGEPIIDYVRLEFEAIKP